MKQSFKGMAIASAVAGLFEVSANAADAKAPTKEGKAAAAQVKCAHANECKGKGACHGMGNGCAGNNECKGKGWNMMTEAECKAKNGSVMADAAAAPEAAKKEEKKK